MSGGLGLCFCGFMVEADVGLWLRQRWLRQRWLRQRRRLVSGGLGLCFCGFLAEAAAAKETAAETSVSGCFSGCGSGETCVSGGRGDLVAAATAFVFLASAMEIYVSRCRLVFLRLSG